MKETYDNQGYLLDPHGAVAYRALLEGLDDDETGIFLETAHPAKFKGTVEQILGTDIQVPEKLLAFMRGTKKSVRIGANYTSFKQVLIDSL